MAVAAEILLEYGEGRQLNLKYCPSMVSKQQLQVYKCPEHIRILSSI
jgi:hypothetical protein